VIAPHDAEGAVCAGKGALLDVFHPSSVHPDGSVVLRFTGHGAGVAADALAIVDDKSVVHSAAKNESYHSRSKKQTGLWQPPRDKMKIGTGPIFTMENQCQAGFGPLFACNGSEGKGTLL
jgi:hypothetical protein